MYADMVRLRIIHKAYGLDVFVAQEQSLTNAMHSIHHPTITRKDNGELEVTILHETHARRHPGRSIGSSLRWTSRAHRFLELTPMERADAANLSPVRSDGRRPRHVARLARRGSGTACALRSLWATPNVGGNRHAALTRAE